jgi:hypothetical protein
VEAFWSPALASRWKKRRQNQPSNIQRHLPRSARRGPFSLRRGLDSVLGFLTLGITSFVLLICLQTTKATLSGRPRFELLCRQGTSGSTSERGPCYRRTAASRRATVGTTCRSRHRPRPS